MIAMLPFISSSESHEASTVDYRIKLIEQAKILFQKTHYLVYQITEKHLRWK